VCRLAALLIGGAFLAVAFLPAEHCHPANDTHRAVVHRHVAPHVVRPTAHASLADDDGLILWMDGGFVARPFTQAGTAQLSAIPAARPVDPEPRADAALWLPGTGRIHDPPWRPSGLRAPPSPSDL
jgi:hypothetical protein